MKSFPQGESRSRGLRLAPLLDERCACLVSIDYLGYLTVLETNVVSTAQSGVSTGLPLPRLRRDPARLIEP